MWQLGKTSRTRCQSSHIRFILAQPLFLSYTKKKRWSIKSVFRIVIEIHFHFRRFTRSVSVYRKWLVKLKSTENVCNGSRIVSILITHYDCWAELPLFSHMSLCACGVSHDDDDEWWWWYFHRHWLATNDDVHVYFPSRNPHIIELCVIAHRVAPPPPFTEWNTQFPPRNMPAYIQFVLFSLYLDCCWHYMEHFFFIMNL